MKTTKLLFTLLALLGMTQAAAQDYEYVPLVREGVKWVYYYVNSDDVYPPDPNLAIGTVFLNLELKGDTIINGKTYKAMHKYYGDRLDTDNDTVPIYLREEDKVVYGIVPDTKFYHDCPISCFGNRDIDSQMYDGKEFILYDFNDPISFWRNYSSDYQYMEELYEETGYRPYKPFKFSDMVTINGRQSRRHVFYNSCFIEGIGYDAMGDGYLLEFENPKLMSAPYFFLSHVIEDGKVIYRSAKESYNSAYLPIAREGVKWVNEHVSISGGDTTRYYYTYEFGHIENNRLNYNCYYSSKDELNPFSDSIVSLGINGNFGGFRSNQNEMLKPILEKGENLIDFQDTFVLYRFVKADISNDCLLNYYIDYQKNDLLNRENFVEVDPLVIEGMSCSRYAYIDEQGDTVAYVVEGIGFDSRDMGDLLTPFTRKPDPNADYQEWCGLSHVIKDGKIIYKGMCYHPIEISGDVNGDGEITVADANSVIDVVIMGGNASHPRIPIDEDGNYIGDVNCDGEVTIADVNAIIDMILNNN